jgi:acetolactate synthase-1/2/3 large subunit
MNMPSAEFSTSDTTPPHDADSIGATVLMRALADENVEFIWGYPGGSVLYIYDELYKQDQIATSKPPCTPRTPIRVPPARSAYAS